MKKPLCKYWKKSQSSFSRFLFCSFFSLLLFCLLSVFSAVKNSHAQTVDEAIVVVEKHYQELVSLTAHVTQKNLLKAMNRTQKYEGVLKIKKPGKLRLEYTNGQLILIDGKNALFYSKKSEQVIKKAFTDFSQMNIPVAFLLGAAHIRDDFEVRQPDAKKPRMLELLPKKPGAAMKKLSIQSDETGRITRMTIYDKAGNTTEISFSEVKEGVGLDDSAFVFKAPKGTEIIEQ